MKLTLEQRVAALEQRLAEMQSHQANGKEKPWLRTMGMFAGDDSMKEIFDEALKIRAKDRERARRRNAKEAPPRSTKK